jgi:hypothetical protein
LVPGLFPVSVAVAEGPPGSLTFDEVLEILEVEPPVSEARRWAIEEARVEPETAARLVRDARGRGALPIIRLRGRFDQGQGTRWDHLNLQDRRDEDTDLTLDLWFEWDLGDLASGPDLLRAVRESRQLVELRQAVVAHVTITYFDRRRLRAEELLAPPDESIMRALDRRLRLQELDATLDGLTGGRWTRALEVTSEASLRPPPPPREAESVAPGPDPRPSSASIPAAPPSDR